LITTLISFIVVIGIIIFVHELGHFLAAKLSGVKVEVFSLGFPPKLWSRKWGETEYQIAWVPLGGFVKMAGMADESYEEGEYNPDDPRGFMKQPFLNKTFILLAGVIMNVLLGFLIYSTLTWTEGIGRMTGTELTMVSEDFPAYEAGIRVGDRIVEVAGRETDTWEKLTNTVREFPGTPVDIKWMRGDSLLSGTVTPRGLPEFNVNTARSDTVGKIGILGSLTIDKVGPFEAAIHGANQVYTILKLNAVSLGALFTGRASVGELTGPLGIARMSGESAKSGAASFFAFIGLISVSIAFLNVLPVPMLDGGHLLFTIIEAVIGRQIPEAVKVNLLKVGLAALILLVLVVSYHDILRFYVGSN
jgi:regulator of sigma E protease